MTKIVEPPTIITSLVGMRADSFRARFGMTNDEIRTFLCGLAPKADELIFSGPPEFLRRVKSIAAAEQIESRFRAKLVFLTH